MDLANEFRGSASAAAWGRRPQTCSLDKSSPTRPQVARPRRIYYERRVGFEPARWRSRAACKPIFLSGDSTVKQVQISSTRDFQSTFRLTEKSQQLERPDCAALCWGGSGAGASGVVFVCRPEAWAEAASAEVDGGEEEEAHATRALTDEEMNTESSLAKREREGGGGAKRD